jgi:hypothetical protein
MTWLPTGLFSATSECGLYEIRGSWRALGFEWRGRVIDSDVLVCASADRSQVEICCARHAAAAIAEAV